MKLLAGKVAYISGAAGGIGAAIAEVFAENDASVVIGDVLKEQGEATAAKIRERGGRAKFVSHDVADESQWEAVIKQTIEEFGGLDILVNNAGIEQRCLLTDVEQADIEKLLAVNVSGPIFGHKHAIRAMRPGGAAGKGGSIVNLSSVAGLIASPQMSVYSATKGAVRLLTKSAAVECGGLGYGIRVNSIHPGVVASDMGNRVVERLVQDGIFPDLEAAKQVFTSNPLGQTGMPVDIGNAALFLASDLSSWVTGTEIVVDGGLSVS